MSVQNTFPHASPVSPTKFKSPSKYKSWKMAESSNGMINPYPPLSIKLDLIQAGICGDVIYRWKHEGTGRRYIGSSLQTRENTFFKRIGKYKSELNGSRKKHRQHIINAVRRSPEKFSIKIVDHRPGIKEPDLLRLEEKYQDLYDTRKQKHGYNHSRPTLEPLRAKKRLWSSSSDSEEFAPQILGFSGEANGQRLFANTSKLTEGEEEKPKTQVFKETQELIQPSSTRKAAQIAQEKFSFYFLNDILTPL